MSEGGIHEQSHAARAAWQSCLNVLFFSPRARYLHAMRVMILPSHSHAKVVA